VGDEVPRSPVSSVEGCGSIMDMLILELRCDCAREVGGGMIAMLCEGVSEGRV